MCWLQWYNQTGDVDKAVSVMMKALYKHPAAVTAGGDVYAPYICDW